MKKKYFKKRQALLLRQSGELLRADAEYQDAMAREIDGELSKAEKEEILIRLKWLAGVIQKTTLESRLSMIEQNPVTRCNGACLNVSK